jgi:protein-L-isoaspartate(D-aspartate) O-methyltransferase
MNFEFIESRQRMVSEQIVRRGVSSLKVLDALRSVPRHRFVPPESQAYAYDDFPLPIGQGQTISQPYIVALMTQLLQLEGEETVLEIGTGSGYQAAVLASIAKIVHSIEMLAELSEKAARILVELDFHNIHLHVGDGSLGWPKAAPYQGILVTAAAPKPPQALLDQLANGGRLVIPVGDRGSQVLQVWEKVKGGWDHEDIVPVAFVPLRGKEGWHDRDWN